MERPWRNKYLFVKEISKEEEIERKKKYRLDDSSTLNPNQRERWECELELQREMLFQDTLTWSSLEHTRLGFHSSLCQTSNVILGKSWKLLISLKLWAHLQLTQVSDICYILSISTMFSVYKDFGGCSEQDKLFHSLSESRKRHILVGGLLQMWSTRFRDWNPGMFTE